MNTVLWTLYFADVATNASAVLILATLGAFGAAGAGKLFTAIDDEPTPAWIKPAMTIGAICCALSVAIPSRTTLYAIAAAKAGEKALQTETGGKAMRAFNAWLDRQIAGEEEEK